MDDSAAGNAHEIGVLVRSTLITNPVIAVVTGGVLSEMYRLSRVVRAQGRLLSCGGIHFSSASTGGPLARYRELIASGSVAEDPQQLHTLQSFDKLYTQLLSYPAPGSAPISSGTSKGAEKDEGFWGSWFSSPKPAAKPATQSTNTSSTAPNGIYLYGGVGCGKTFMMDLFYDSLPIQKKRRIHFNDFMIDTHKKLHQLRKNAKQTDYILETLTSDLIKSSYVLCFDEFQVGISSQSVNLC